MNAIPRCSRPLPRYRSHKVVQALKIKEIRRAPYGAGVSLVFELEDYPPAWMDSQWAQRHKPEPGGYYVVYPDGYRSYSPAQAFEEGYTRIDPPAEQQIRTISVKDFRRLGYLQELNRRFLHPLGLALSVLVPEDGEQGEERFGPIWDYRDDPEGMLYGGELNVEAAIRIAEEMETHCRHRRKLHGFDVQPVTVDQPPAPSPNPPTSPLAAELLKDARNTSPDHAPASPQAPGPQPPDLEGGV